MEKITIKDYKGDLLYDFNEGIIKKKEDVVFKKKEDWCRPAREVKTKESDFVLGEIWEELKDDIIQLLYQDFDYYIDVRPIKYSESKMERIKKLLLELKIDMLLSNRLYEIDCNTKIVEYEFDLVGYLKKHLKPKQFKSGEKNYFFTFNEISDGTEDVRIANEVYVRLPGVKYFDCEHEKVIEFKLKEERVTSEKLETALKKMRWL